MECGGGGFGRGEEGEVDLLRPESSNTANEHGTRPCALPLSPQCALHQPLSTHPHTHTDDHADALHPVLLLFARLVGFPVSGPLQF